MKQSLFSLCLATVATLAMAEPYRSHNVSQVLTPNKIDMVLADRIARDLSQHAGNYPIHFDTPADKKRAESEVKQLIAIFQAVLKTNVVTPKHAAYRSVLMRLARLNWIAHNMDIPNAAFVADESYRQLLNQSLSRSERASVQDEYGRFLGSVGHTQAAINMLTQAWQNGYRPAQKSLGLAYLMMKQNDKAQTHLSAYIKQFPKDQEAQDLLNALHNGKVEVHQVSMP